jgi:hypothetical protein
MKRLLFTLCVFLGLTGATWPLNPLVTRSATASGAVPSGCDESLAPSRTPRIDVVAIPAPDITPAALTAPPSRTLRRTLEEAHGALARNDRPAFDTALGSARELLGDYPPGAERTAAEESLRVYEDAALLWNAQFESPFFAESSEAHARVSRYPGYAEAVRRGMLTDDAERRFYPAAESRDFLTRIAAQRLERLGVRATTRLARAERPATSPERSTPSVTAKRRASPSSAGTTATRRNASPRRASTTPVPRSRKSASPAIAAPASPDPPASAKALAESAPAMPPAADPTPAAPASPAAESSAPALEAASSSAAVTDSGSPTEAPEQVATTAATETKPPAAEAAPRRSLIVPALLIAIGLGVLFVLFRVSK